MIQDEVQDEVQDLGKMFKAASDWLSSSPAAANLPNDLKLELYGLFKYTNSGTGPTGSRPSIFSLAPRAKYDAWVAQSTKYSVPGAHGVQGAQRRYIEIARQVGWDGSIEEDSEEGSDIDLEDDSPAAGPSSSGDGEKGNGKAKAQGMGTKVSVMARASVEGGDVESVENPLHDAVLDGDAARVERILKSDPHAVHAKDEGGNTSLHLAVDRGHVDVVKTLVHHGADKSTEDQDGLTPLMMAQELGRDELVGLLR